MDLKLLKTKQIKAKLLKAIQEGNLSQLQTTVSESNYNFADPLLLNYTLLSSSLSSKQLDVANWLIEHGCPVNRQFDESLSSGPSPPLHLAVLNSYYDIVRTLLQHGAQPDAFNTNNVTALHLACKIGNIQAVRLLLASAKPGIVNIPDHYGSTALHLATEKNCLEIVQLLLQCSPNLKVRTRDKNFKNYTAFHIAIKTSAEKYIIEALLDAGSDINAIFDYWDYSNSIHYNSYCNYKLDCCTPLDYALIIRNYKLAKLLLMRNGNVNALIQQHNFSLTEPMLHDIVLIFTKYIVLLKSMKKDIHNNILNLLSKYHSYNKKERACSAEIEKMKRTNIIDGLSFYDFLVKQSNALVAYGRNRKLIQVFNQSFEEHKEQFLLYYDKLMDQLNIAQHRVQLLEESILVFNTIFPYVVCEKIFDYLNIQDLKNISLIKSSICNSQSVNSNLSKKDNRSIFNTDIDRPIENSLRHNLFTLFNRNNDRSNLADDRPIENLPRPLLPIERVSFNF